MTNRSIARGAIVAALVVGVGGAAAVAATGGPPAPSEAIRAHFSQEHARLPEGYRRWEHVGTRYKPIGINILDGKPTETPEILNAYVEPHALEAWRRTGRWPDGTQMVKEFSQVRTGAGCDAATGVCTGPLGAGLFETGFFGLGMMIKDARRFPDSPGHWGYFSFGHKAPPYEPVSTVAPQAQCSACHVRLASHTDYVVSQAHIGLSNGWASH